MSVSMLEKMWLCVNGRRVAEVEKAETYPYTMPGTQVSFGRRIRVWVAGNEYDIPPKGVVRQLPGANSFSVIEIDISLSMEEAFDYAASGLLPKQIEDAFSNVIGPVEVAFPGPVTVSAPTQEEWDHGQAEVGLALAASLVDVTLDPVALREV